MTALSYILTALIGYGFGCLNLAWLLARIKGFDIRGVGAHNAGASNATITMGWKAGVAVGVHDILKACLAALLAGLLFPDLSYAPALAGAMAVMGHIFPFYLHFRGGKGFASFLGMILALDWRFFLGILVAVLLITLITDYVVMGTFTTIVSFPLYLLVLHRGAIMAAIVAAASLVILCKHFVNIRRLLTGQEIGLRRTMRKEDRV